MIALLRIPLQLLILMYQSFMLALTQVWANKTRSLLTTLGIVIGVASVSTIIAALSGLRASVLSQFEAFGTNKVFIFPDRPDSGPLRNASRRLIWFRPEEFDGMLEHCPSLKTFTRTCPNQNNVTYQGHTEEEVQVTGIEPSWHEIENRPITLGRPFSMIDNDRARPVCVINTILQDKLNLPSDCIGATLFVGQRRYLVIGVVAAQAAGLLGGNTNEAEVFVPFTTLYGDNGGPAYMPFVYVTAASKSPDLSEEAKGEISFFLRHKRHIRPGDPDTFNVRFVAQFVDQFDKTATIITEVAGGIVSISLLVGGVGIMNIMLVSVSERTREIGLRKAVGARPAAIMLQFLVEAVFLCLLGGCLGLLIGQGLTLGMSKLFEPYLDKAFIPGWAIALSFGFSALVGLVFGMFPAIKAARLDPIEALRHE